MAVILDSGALRHFVTVKQPTFFLNDEGGRETVYTTLVSTVVVVENIANTRESDPVALLDTKNFYIRWASDRIITADHILIYKNILYTVNGVQLIEERDRWIKINAKARGTNSGAVANQYPQVEKIEYIGTGGELELTYSELSGKTLLYVGRSGIAFKVLTSGSPNDLQVLFSGSTLTFGSPLSIEEWVLILYQ